MLYVTVIYPNKDGATFDFEYYMKKHIPMATAMFGAAIEVRKGIGSLAGAPAFLCMGTIPIRSIEEFQAVMAQRGGELLADIPNYTNVEPVVQFDEVLPNATHLAA